RDILWEERAIAGCDLERSATSHRIDDLHERGQHRTIHDIDGAHERDAPCERDEGEGKAANVAAEETERQAKTGRPHSRWTHIPQRSSGPCGGRARDPAPNRPRTASQQLQERLTARRASA